MVWREVVDRTSQYLQSKSVADAVVCAELLAARLLKTGRGTLGAQLSREASERELEAMRRGMTRLVKGEPIQYVLGEWDFRTLTLKCDRRALIPRPETEELVELVLKYLHNRIWNHPPVIVDVGTGTGAIALSIAAEFKGEAVVIGTDISEDAIALARENAALTGLERKAKLVVADGLDDFDEPESIDIIVSNPPYIASAVCETLDRNVRDFEPRLALDGGASGLDFYDRYLADAVNLLKPGGAVFFEIGEDQGAALRRLLTDYGFGEIKIDRDLAGHDRFAQGFLA